MCKLQRCGPGDQTSGAEKKGSDYVLRELDTSRNLLETLNKRTSVVGHILMNHDFIIYILGGKNKGKERSGRPALHCRVE